MFRRDWRTVLAFAVTLVVLASGLGYYVIEKATKPEFSASDYQPARDPSFPHRRVAGEPKANAYDPNCSEPATQGDSDLCAQWVAAKSVDHSNSLVRVGILASFVLGAVGVAATTIGTALVYRSLKQNDRAFDIAMAANRLAADQFDMEASRNRSYLVFGQITHNIDSDYERGAAPATWSFDIENIGAVPAEVIALEVVATAHQGMPPTIDTLDLKLADHNGSRLESGSPVFISNGGKAHRAVEMTASQLLYKYKSIPQRQSYGPQGAATYTTMIESAKRAGISLDEHVAFWALARVTYRDITGGPQRQTAFCVRTGLFSKTIGFVETGGYNYRN